MPTLTDLSTIRDLCARYDFALSKGFGQNFIINPGICPRIAEAAGIGSGWGALEVGPGIGVLTEQLCKRADKVVSIEVDKRLPPLLEETMAGYDNFKLVLNDVLKVDLKALLAEEFGDKPVAVCANLPYYITSDSDAPAGGKAAYPEHYRHGAKGGRTAPVRRPWHPRCGCDQLRSCLLCGAEIVVQRAARQLLSRPQGDKRRHSLGCAQDPRRTGSER